MADMSITFAEVREKAAKIGTLNDSLMAGLTTIKAEINALESQWTSDTSETIRAKITAMQTRFDEYQTVVKSYQEFLVATADTYEATEASTNSNASQFI